MSYVDLCYATWRSFNNIPYEHVQVEPSELRKAIGLKWHFGPGDEQLTPQDLGKIIDDCLVENISGLQIHLEKGRYGVEEFKWDIRFLEERMRDDRDLRAYADSLPVDSKLGKLRPASEVYIKLAKRHIIDKEKQPVSPEDGRRFAKVLLDEHMNEDRWKYDWNIEKISRSCADRWRRYRDDGLLQELIKDSPRNAAAWDALQLIGKDSVESGETHLLPTELLQWYLRASHGDPKRPEVPTEPLGRPTTHGYRLRNSEFRHTVYLLIRVDMRRTAARNAVAKAVNLAESTIRKACREDYFTLEDLHQDALRRSGPPA